MKRKAIIGDVQNIAIDFPDAKAGDVYVVEVKIENPEGVIVSHVHSYEFYKPITKRASENKNE